MKTKILHSYGNKEISSYEFDLGDMESNQMLIKTIYTGICRSDIDQYLGHIEIPFGHFGHESIGEVIKVGSSIKNFKIGDYVASRNDPAYSEYFYGDENNTVKVSNNTPEYIIEPVACSVNIADSVIKLGDLSNDVLIVGSGFISNVVAQYLRNLSPSLKIYVVGNHNQEQWDNIRVTNIKFEDITRYNKTFKTCIELSGKAENFDKIMSVAAPGALICLGAAFETPISTTFWKQLWNNYTIIFPSPRNESFHSSMLLAEHYITQKHLTTAWAWTHMYNVQDYKKAFEESISRNTTEPFVRSYIKW